MSKTINEGWPDPTDWVNRLRDELIKAESLYINFVEIQRGKIDLDELGNDDVANTDPRSNQLLTASKSLSLIVSALKEFPAFSKNEGLLPLRDLAAAIHRLDEGGRPELLQPREGETSPGDTLLRRIVKHHAVLCVLVLISAGCGEQEAQKTVATLFSRAGHRGRKGGALNWKTIRDWCKQCKADGKDRHGHKWITRKLATFRQHSDWPPSKEQAVAYAARIANSKELQTVI